MMKKNDIAKAAIIVGIILGTAVVEAGEAKKPGWIKRTFGKLSWEEVALVARTPKAICARVRHTVDYREDLGDEWSTGKETWERGHGDCEDLAAAVAELAAENGIKAVVYVFYPKRSWLAHAVVIGEYKGKTWMSSNGWYQTVKSLDQAKRAVAKEQGWCRHQLEIKKLVEVGNPQSTGHTTVSASDYWVKTR